jgi:hypothetical protein
MVCRATWSCSPGTALESWGWGTAENIQVKATRRRVRRRSVDPARQAPSLSRQCTGPGGVVFASWPTASVIRRLVGVVDHDRDDMTRAA